MALLFCTPIYFPVLDLALFIAPVSSEILAIILWSSLDFYVILGKL